VRWCGGGDGQRAIAWHSYQICNSSLFVSKPSIIIAKKPCEINPCSREGCSFVWIYHFSFQSERVVSGTVHRGQDECNSRFGRATSQQNKIITFLHGNFYCSILFLFWIKGKTKDQHFKGHSPPASVNNQVIADVASNLKLVSGLEAFILLDLIKPFW